MSKLNPAGVMVKVRSHGPSTVTVQVTQGKHKGGRPNGLIVYRGPSLLNGRRIVVVVTGFARSTRNGKTGRMLQSYILADRIDPMTAKMKGADRTVCGDCPHRAGSCYVNVVQGPLAVWRAVKR